MTREVARREIESLDYYLQNHTDDYSEESHTAMMMAISALSENKGEWIADVDKWGDVVTTVNGYTCSKCGMFNSDKDNFCPNCGAKMKGGERMSKGALNVDKAIWELYEKIPHLLCEQPYGKNGRYITYYAEERLYLVFDLWYHGFFLVEADSPKDAIVEVNCDRLKYVQKEKE